jgi:hypothetical protein
MLHHSNTAECAGPAEMQVAVKWGVKHVIMVAGAGWSGRPPHSSRGAASHAGQPVSAAKHAGHGTVLPQVAHLPGCLASVFLGIPEDLHAYVCLRWA